MSGEPQFLAEYRKERVALESDGLPWPVPALREFPLPFADSPAAVTPPPPDGFLAERDPARFTLEVRLRNGRISSASLVGVARIAREFGPGLVVATQQQDLLIPGIPQQNVVAARSALIGLGFDTTLCRPKIVACAGASTCKLGLCLSPGLAEAIEERLRQESFSAGPEVIRLSGCPNACGNHTIATLGFEGRARRHDGRLMPLYQVLAGGQPGEGQCKFAERLGVVPARAIPELVAEISSMGLTSAEAIRPLVEKYQRLPEPAPDELYTDVGQSEPFSLAGRGPGECGAGVLDIIRVDLEEAAEALAAAQFGRFERTRAIHRTLVATARALLPLFGIEARKDREVFSAVSQYLVVSGWIEAETEALLAAALDWRMGDRASLDDLLDRARAFHQRVLDLFTSLDSNLQFRLQPLRSAPSPATTVAAVKLIDLRGVACPMNFVKAKVALEKIAVGETLEALLDDGAPVRNVPASFTEQGQEILTVTPEGPYFRVTVKRKR